MVRLTALASLALGIALGVVAALFLVLWRSGAEPDEPAVREPRGVWTANTSGKGITPERFAAVRPSLERAAQIGLTEVHDGATTWRWQPIVDGEAVGIG